MFLLLTNGSIGVFCLDLTCRKAGLCCICLEYDDWLWMTKVGGSFVRENYVLEYVMGESLVESLVG